jgi:hypothetical protein
MRTSQRSSVASVASVAVLALTALAVLAACGSDDDAKPTAVGSLSCQSAPGPCDQDETNQYGQCVADRCDAEYQACFGPTYRNGTFGGPCGTYYTCLAKCGCNDNACRQACGIAPYACQVCLASRLTTCANNSGCKRPSCVAQPPPGGNTCADLLRCCNGMTDPNERSFCISEYQGAVRYGDFICSTFVQGFRASGMCR